MAEPSPVAPLAERRPLPDKVMLDQTAGMPAYSPAEMEQVEDFYGKPFGEIAGTAKGIRVSVWLHLRRLGYECGLEEAGQVLVEHPPPDPPEPAS